MFHRASSLYGAFGSKTKTPTNASNYEFGWPNEEKQVLQLKNLCRSLKVMMIT